MHKKYALEIYQPGSIQDVLVVFESDTPFLPISTGDLLNQRAWPDGGYEGQILRVVGLEHFVWEIDGVTKHKIGVITETVQDTRDARFTR
jgi:hypothetical protein